MTRRSIPSGTATSLATAIVVALASMATAGGPTPHFPEEAAAGGQPAPGAATADPAAGREAVQGEPATGEVALVTVVGCLAEEAGDLPWILERATAGEPTEQAFTSEEELARSAGETLGDLRYRLLGVGEFGVASHVGHRVQAKGLKLRYDGEWRLNITSFQHLAPTCE
ncbi:MAG: hypothetical protein OXH69_04380 [Acidobacteria bacterium]|nr:hypothetical protein [Acidobacteriota bacterium]